MKWVLRCDVGGGTCEGKAKSFVEGGLPQRGSGHPHAGVQSEGPTAGLGWKSSTRSAFWKARMRGKFLSHSTKPAFEVDATSDTQKVVFAKNQIAKSHFRDRFVEKHVSAMRRWKLLSETAPLDGLSCKKCLYHLQTHTRPPRACGGGAPMHPTAQEVQSPGRAGKRHKRQHPPNTHPTPQTPANTNTDKQHSDHLP